MNYCEKCGKELTEGVKFCTNCGNNVQPVQQTNNTNNKQPLTPEDNKKANMLCWLSLLFNYGVPILSIIIGFMMNSGSTVLQFVGNIISSVIGISSMAGLALMIVVRIKYPQNTFGKVLMWIYIIQYILCAIAIILLILACGAFITDFLGAFSSCH